MLRRKKSSHRKATLGERATEERKTPSTVAVEALRSDATSQLSKLESYFGTQARVTVYVRERKTESESGSSSTSANSSSSGSPVHAVAHRDAQYQMYIASRSVSDPAQQRRADCKYQRRVRSRRERERRKVYKKQNLIIACIEMATGSETAVSPSGCLTFSEAIESAALAFLLKVDDEYDSFVDQSMETSLRSTTSSKSASPARTPRSPFLPNKLKLSGSRPIDARPNTARLYKSPRSGDAQQCTDLSRSTSGTKKISKLKRAVKKSSRH